MTPAEAAVLLEFIGEHRDSRGGGTAVLAQDDPVLWAEVLTKGGTCMTLHACLDAFAEHWQEGHRWVCPTHLVQRVVRASSVSVR